MGTFSQRMGLEPLKRPFQTESMDDDLRTDLWNCLSDHYLTFYGDYVTTRDPLYPLTRALWVDFLRNVIDDYSSEWYSLRKHMREYFFDAPWNKVYELIEFVLERYTGDVAHKPLVIKKRFSKQCNALLERNNAGYRVVDGIFTPIIDGFEIVAIERAAALSSPLAPVSLHIRAALRLLSDRESPDYRNSVKESISAVEALCAQIAGKPTATLGAALKEIEKQGKVKFHRSLQEAFSRLYGYTNDADGIRHALKDEPNLGAEDATFMLVTCSAFINFLVQKATKAGIAF